MQVYASYLEVYNEVGYDLLDGSFSSASEAKGAGGTKNDVAPHTHHPFHPEPDSLTTSIDPQRQQQQRL